MRHLLGLLATTSLLGSASAQEPKQVDLYTVSRNAVMAGRYLDATAVLEAEAFKPGAAVNGLPRQLWTQYTPFVTGELDPAVFGADTPPADPAMLAQLAAARPRDAVAEIARRARDTRIVILNEAHFSPRDRAFALEVARALRPLGYSVLAAETFRNDPEAGQPATGGEQLQQDGIVRRSTGFYSADPVFANFLRGAHALGYRTVAYEQRRDQTTPDGGVPEREEAQAQNLLAMLRANPAAKVLVYVGHGHVMEGSSSAGPAMMAERLKRLSGIDPLTVDQVRLAGLRPRLRVVQMAASARVGSRPAIFMKGDTPLILGDGDAGAVDLQVVHPLRSYRHGRPSWLATFGGRPVAIAPALLPTTGKRLIQAFDAAEPADAVPLDQVLVEAGKPAPMLLLPAGRRIRYAVQEPSSLATASR
ncbi:hypothetical protein [Sphingomonas aracearum]|uniref:Haem-binding uptake Tiki superfamily ChaN domain-containing protein n=1 Tax=Sphingomonas aracearum TaxID=2283317 RepID=A0A369VZB3_9SPHN|nr:hypothetical protein [Sphingomonas aracearum]RDE06977.1 hypothetical protein DVW87_04745 [Sphingomonas aracearum]